MAERREEMIWMGGAAAEGGVRSDDAPTVEAAAARPALPDPEVVAKPRQCQFTVEYKLRIFEETNRCYKPGEIGRILRREGSIVPI